MTITPKTLLFWILFAVLAITFFTRDNYRSVKNIHPDVLRQPAQSAVSSGEPIAFEKNGFSYSLNPLYEYDLSGLVVSRLNYDSWYSLSRTDSVFPVDLCVIWGENVSSGAYRKKRLSFDQDFRFCLYNYSGQIDFNGRELSNNHLVIKSEAMEKMAKKIRPGDQVRVRGKLADVKATAVGEVGKYEPEIAVWHTSTTREDDGAGACEVIFVEEIKILKHGNPISSLLFEISKYGLILMIALAIFRFFFGK